MNLPDFSKKVVLVSFVSGAPNNVAVVEEGKFEMQGDQLFLVGRAAQVKFGWGPGVVVGVAWNKVQSYCVFDSVEDFNTSYFRHMPDALKQMPAWWKMWQQ